jgi:parallel beta-helix repeat protein
MGMRTLMSTMIAMNILISIITGFITIIPEYTSAATPHDPIFIEGELNFTSLASNEGWKGDGTSENPYLIKDLKISPQAGHCIEIRNSSLHFIIQDSQLINGTGGVYLSNVSNGEVKGCTIQDNQLGLLLENSQDIKVLQNTLSSNLDGIYLFKSKLNEVEGNNVSLNNGEGITLFRSIENSILSNTLLGNQYALALIQSDNNEISYNTASENVGGIQLQGSHNNLVNWNSLYNNDIGMYLLNNCTENKITYNDISLNFGSGIILVKTRNNTFHHNNIIENNKQLTLTLSFDNWHDEDNKGNYWSDYKGNDTDEDGVGDTGIPHNNVDFYPLIEPVKIQNGEEDEDGVGGTSTTLILTIVTVFVTFILFTYFGYRMGQRRNINYKRNK